MSKQFKAIVLGDAMIGGEAFGDAAKKYLSPYISDLKVGEWESDWGKLQNRRLEVEKHGPEIEVVDELIQAEDLYAALTEQSRFTSFELADAALHR